MCIEMHIEAPLTLGAGLFRVIGVYMVHFRNGKTLYFPQLFSFSTDFLNPGGAERKFCVARVCRLFKKIVDKYRLFNVNKQKEMKFKFPFDESINSEDAMEV